MRERRTAPTTESLKRGLGPALGPYRGPATLVLADGRVFRGLGFGGLGTAIGEVVFNTAMAGYQEIITDPSYTGQLVCLTTSEIGNVGVNGEDEESRGHGCAGLLVRSLSPVVSNHRAERTLTEYLGARAIPGMAEFDTRALTRHIREAGAMMAALSTEEHDVDTLLARVRDAPGMEGADLASRVSTPRVYGWDERSWDARHNASSSARTAAQADKPADVHIVVVDFGVKHNILRRLRDAGARSTVVPASTTAAELLELAPDGVLLSNGPGDPAACEAAIHEVRRLLADRPADHSRARARAHGRRSPTGSHGYILSKRPILRSRSLELPGRQRRIALLSTVAVRDDVELTIVTTHLESFLEDGPTRARQLDAIFEALMIEDEAVVLGDLNFERVLARPRRALPIPRSRSLVVSLRSATSSRACARSSASPSSGSASTWASPRSARWCHGRSCMCEAVFGHRCARSRPAQSAWSTILSKPPNAGSFKPHLAPAKRAPSNVPQHIRSAPTWKSQLLSVTESPSFANPHAFCVRYHSVPFARCVSFPDVVMSTSSRGAWASTMYSVDSVSRHASIKFAFEH